MAMNKRQLRYDYDTESDELSITFGGSRPSIAREVGDEFFVQLDPVTKEVVGFTVLGFSKRVHAKEETMHHFAVPVELQGQFQFAG